MRSRSSFAILTVSLMLLLPVNQVVGKIYGEIEDPSREHRDEVLAPFRDLRNLVIELLETCDDPTDSDNDTLPDKVEWVIGTDHMNDDSDFDKLDDAYEVMHGMDPQKPDSNMDGIPDSIEVKDVPMDVDMDGVENAWDRDNDNDGISDRMDLSPFHATKPNSTFHFSISATGKPLYLELQLRPKDPDHLRLIGQKYDWPSDNKGSFRQLDDSVEDVVSTPFLDVEMNMQIDQEDVEDYGMSINGNSSILSINPVREDGMVVAFHGKVFIPPFQGPKEIKLDVSMRWKITGMNDHKGNTLIWKDGRSVLTYNDGIARVEDVEEGEVLLLNELGQDRIALRDLQGNYLSLSEEGVITCDSSRMEDESVFVMDKKGDSFTLKDEEERYLQANPDGSISAVAADDPSELLWEFADRGLYDQPMVLAIYDEDIILTGFSVEESYGTGVGMVYGDDIDMMTAANLALTYEFMRNTTNMLDDVPKMFGDHNITCDMDIAHFGHSDAALIHAIDEMKGKALDSLPEDTMLPITMIMDDRGSSIFMEDILNASCFIGSQFQIDMEEEPVIRSRIMKSSYYIMPDDESIDMDEVMKNYREMSLSKEALETILYYTVPWMTGDQVVISIGTELQEFSFPEIDITSQTIQLVIEIGITTMTTLHDSVILISSAIHLSKLAKLGGTSMFSKGSLSLYQSIHKALSATDHPKFGKWNKFGKCLVALEVVIAVGMSIFALITIGNAFDWSAVGTGIAVMYSVMMVAYSVLLIVIAGLAPPFGFFAAMIIALSDMIVGWICGDGWFQMFLEWFIGLFTDFNERTTVDLEMVDSKLDIDDKDGNGLSAGDRITYEANSTGIVSRTSHGSHSDLLNSYIKPNFRVAVPARSNSVKSEYLKVNSETISSKSKTTSYTSGFWVEPGIGMVNYPATFWLESQYRVYYEECWWFFGWHCDRKSNSGSSNGDATTIYFDVMPKDIDEFGSWRGITPLDADGDGINNTDEDKTHPWKWDTDGDGLSDSLEKDFGSDPVKPDTDSDGIFDRSEFNWYMDPNSDDTDSDGMSDYQEHKGWVVNFDFCGRSFNWTINSDPRLNDTDGDGINDYMEYVCKLNPRSSDTDGDGVVDRLRDYYLTSMEHDPSYLVEEIGDFIVFSNGTVINLDGEYGRIRVYTANGTLESEIPWNGDFDFPDMIEHGPNGTIIFADHQYIHFFDSNWTSQKTYPFLEVPWAINALHYKNNLIYIACNCDGIVDFAIMDPGNGSISFPEVEFEEYFGRFSGICVGDDGKVYLSIYRHYYVDYDKIYVVSSDLKNVSILGTSGTGEGQFSYPMDMICDENGDILVAEYGNNRIQKFEASGRFIMEYGGEDLPINEFLPWYLDSDMNGRLFIKTQDNLFRIYHNRTFHEVNETEGFEDTDGDGLSDMEEDTGHLIDVNYHSRSVQVNVTSDPKIFDTDGDGLDDHLEWNISSDPRATDTDRDGLPDLEEFGLGTNLSDKDTDGDGLSDGEELSFLSSPLIIDTDGDGLNDLLEFENGCDPNSNDTDQDGLTDKVEVDLGWDPLNADPDGDFMFDSAEKDAGTSSDHPDKDRDGLIDGFEGIYETDPLSGDSDGDRVPDGFEVKMKMNPIKNDTDGDGLLDGEEMEMGSNPLSTDSDGDGIKDSEDLDFTLVLDEPVVVVHDMVDGIEGYLENLSSSVEVTLVDPADVDDHLDSKYIVIVGKPSNKRGSAGNITRSILPDEMLDAMKESEMNRFATRFGEWTENQTIVMLSTPYNSDHYRTLGMLKSMNMMVKDGMISATFMNPRCCFSLDDFEIVKETRSTIRGSFASNLTFNVEVERKEMVDFKREDWTGLKELEVPFGDVLEFHVTPDMVAGAEVEMFFTDSDLDLSDDGSINGPGDILENSIGLFYMNESSMSWERVNESQEWVEDVTLNETDFESYGIRFSGRIRAKLRHLSAYALVGRMIEHDGLLDVVANISGVGKVFVGDELILNASGSSGNGWIVNYTWMIPSLELISYGPLVTLNWDVAGTFDVHLRVTDQLGLIAEEIVTIEVMERAVSPIYFTLEVGPVMDEEGAPIRDATVLIIWNSTNFSNSTGEDGITSLILPMELLNKTVRFVISSEGYEPIDIDLRISPEGKVEGIPALKRIEEEPEVKSEEDRFPYWIFLILILLIMIAVVVVVIRRKNREEMEE